MDVREPKLASVEQEVVLRGLAQHAARPRCKFLEVGSWCGHSTIILAKVAQKFGGRLFCVDWWKGTEGTKLASIASQEDVYALFWQRVCAEGLQDVVVPIRGPSGVVAPILRSDSFQLVFLDADHRYLHVKRDIHRFGPLVSRKAGVLCGHDCEGRVSDYDPEFLEAGKDLDCHESVHCGVVAAVGEALSRYSVNHGIWSARAERFWSGWEATELTYPGIADRRQPPPPPVGATKTHNLIRYGRRVYSVPHGWSEFDVTDETQRNHPGIKSARTKEQAAEFAQAAMPPHAIPTLIEEGYLGFNIVAFAGVYYSVAQTAGELDFSQLCSARMRDLTEQGKLYRANSQRAARLNIALAVLGRGAAFAPQAQWTIPTANAAAEQSLEGVTA